MDLCFLFSWVYLGMESESHVNSVLGFLVFFFEELQNCFPKYLHHFTFLLAMYQEYNFSISSHTTLQEY